MFWIFSSLQTSKKIVSIDEQGFSLALQSIFHINNSYYDPRPKEEKDVFFKEKFNKNTENNKVISSVLSELDELSFQLNGVVPINLFDVFKIKKDIKKNQLILMSKEGIELYNFVKKKNLLLKQLVVHVKNNRKKLLNNSFFSNLFKSWTYFKKKDLFKDIKPIIKWVPISMKIHYGTNLKKVLEHKFNIANFEVTQMHWFSVMGYNKAHFRLKEHCPLKFLVINKFNLCPNNPVENISYEEVLLFLKRINYLDSVYFYRLPTESEWEYAVRAGSKTNYYFGSSQSELINHAWFSHNSGEKAHPVGRKLANPNGLFDVYGNVWELLHIKKPNKNSRPIIKGGYWHGPPWFLYSRSMGTSDFYTKADDVGFRLVRFKRSELESENEFY